MNLSTKDTSDSHKVIDEYYSAGFEAALRLHSKLWPKEDSSLPEEPEVYNLIQRDGFRSVITGRDIQIRTTKIDISDSSATTGKPDYCVCEEPKSIAISSANGSFMWCDKCYKPIKPQPESVKKINKLAYGLLFPDELVDKINDELDKLTIIKEDKC